MGNSEGIHSAQIPEILSAQVITAHTTVKTDLATIINEADSNRATNTFLNSGVVSTSSSANLLPSVTLVAQQTTGAAQSSGEINDGGQPTHRDPFINDGEQLQVEQ